MIGKMSPYVELRAGPESFKTPPMHDAGANPEFKDQMFIFNLDGKTEFLHIRVVDHRSILADDPIGVLNLKLTHGFHEKYHHERAHEFVIYHPKQSEKVTGVVFLKLKFVHG